MLVLQIAAGVILAVLVVRFWKQSLVLGVVLALLAGFVVLILAANRGRPDDMIVVQLIVGLVLGGAAIRWVVGKVQARGERAVIVDDDRDSPAQDPPASHPS